MTIAITTSSKITSFVQRKLVKPLLYAGAIATILLSGEASAQNKTLTYLKSIQGQKVLGGMHNRQPNSDPTKYSRQLNGVIGQWPALYSADFGFESAEIANRQTMINQIKTEWNNGAVVQLMWHACNPAKSRPCGWDSNGVLSSMSSTEWANLITNGTTINNNWKAMMDEVAVYLQQLEDAGVEVLFRPLHEQNQPIFWWAGRTGSNGTAKLWQLTHDYLVNTKGLTNLIWVWDLQDFGTIASDVNNYDPGPNYYDILALDVYWSDGQGYTTSKYNAIANKANANNKLIALGECQDLPDASLFSSQPKWAFFMGWSELVFSSNTTAKIQSTYLSDRVLTLNEMPGWKSGSTSSAKSSSIATSSKSSSASSTSSNTPIYVQAESFSAMSGVVVGSSAAEAGTVVGSIDTNDWMSYNSVNIPTTGAYTIAYRVASLNGGGSLRLEEAGGGTLYGTVAVPKTGGWDTWTTIYQTVTLTAGTHNLGIKAAVGGWNLNWFSRTKN